MAITSVYAADFPGASAGGSNDDVLILAAQKFPAVAADTSFVERNKVLAQGYEPFEATYDLATGKCIRNCVYSGISIETEIDLIERDLAIAMEVARRYAPKVPTAIEVEESETTAPLFPSCEPNHPNIANDQIAPKGNPLRGNPRMTSDFGKRIRNGELEMHYGMDFSAPVGTPVFSPIAGIVESVKYANDKCGYQVKISSGEFAVRFCHLSKITVNKGDFVDSGCQVAYSGNTGTSTTGPHLHYEVSYQSRPVPPKKFL